MENLVLSNNKFAVVMDWLTISFDSNLTYEDFKDGIYETESFRLILQDYPTRQFKRVALVVSNDLDMKPIGTITFEPHSKVLDRKLLQLKFDNWLFYDAAPFSWIYDAIITEFPWSFKSVSRMDIAIDGLEISEFWQGLKSGKYDLLHTTTQTQIENLQIKTITERTRKNEISETFYLGKSTSGKSVKYYNKTMELKRHDGKKQYITDFHKQSGLNTDSDIFRLEMSLTSKTFRKINSFDIEKFLIDIEQNGFDLFHSFMYDIVLNDGKTRRSNSQRVYLYDFVNKVKSVFETVKNEVSDVVNTVKISIKNALKMLYACVFDDVESTAILDSTVSQIERFQLWEWLKKRQKFWHRDFRKYCDNNNHEHFNFYNSDMYSFLDTYKSTLGYD